MAENDLILTDKLRKLQIESKPVQLEGKSTRSVEKGDGVEMSESSISDNSPLSVFLVSFKAARTQWVARQAIIMISLLFRLAVGLGSFSGENVPPLHGDFEAQRHWMEITYQLPMSQWYWYDLPYWGLDYPPLTAYHSWIMGWVGTLFNPVWFALNSSRGCEQLDLKSYMRSTVVISDVLIYIPAVTMFIRWKINHTKLSPYFHTISTAMVLLQPSLILIDHGHFQYNSVMLGFAIAAIAYILEDRIVVGSVFFVMALTFKQMALYYAIPVFAYLLGICLYPRLNIARFISLAIATILTFGVLVLPIGVSSGYSAANIKIQLTQIMIRVFPFARGLWEDKVANFWCATNIIFKYKYIFSELQLQRLSFAATLISVLPSFILLLRHPRKNALVWAVSASAFGFYLFSFQVHEKSILLPLLPITLQLVGELDIDIQCYIYWINNVAYFSLWPLVKKDGLVMQYFLIGFLWNWLMHSYSRLPSSYLAKFIIVSSYLSITVLHILEFVIEPPSRYPDLWIVANVELCFSCFFIFAIWNNWMVYKTCMS
ncbi:glycosyl transferase [Lipomyces oligophaga]|uniref:glycosyl transferase n=1 Tax=Lipomyces oligophaga TaxID=45792 RepID=UPI0034CE71F2